MPIPYDMSDTLPGLLYAAPYDEPPEIPRVSLNREKFNGLAKFVHESIDTLRADGAIKNRAQIALLLEISGRLYDLSLGAKYPK